MALNEEAVLMSSRSETSAGAPQPAGHPNATKEGGADMTRIHIPASLADAKRRLVGIEQLLTATGWERAAIIAAFVRLDTEGGDRRSITARSSSDLLSCSEFAGFGIAGLMSKDTVRKYVQCWLDASGGKYPKPGASVTLPKGPFPPEKDNIGSRPTPSNIGDQLTAKPELAQAAAEALARPGGPIEHVKPDTVRNLGRTVDERRVRDHHADPNPPRISDRGKTAGQFEDDAYWDRVRDALRLLFDLKMRLRRDEFAIVPGDVAILMELLVPETDWDEAARSLIGEMS